MPKKLNYKAPFLEDGSVPSYPSNWDILRGKYQEVKIDWKDVEPFYADLRFTGMDKGSHGSTRYTLKNLNSDANYCMFTVDVLDILMTHGIQGGILHGYWVVQKRGQNYGIRYIGEEVE